MRVKLSYTAEIEEVLPEASYLLKNLSDSINEMIKNYNSLLEILADEEEFNNNGFFTTVDEVRQAIGRIDLRLIEVQEIVSGYQGYLDARHRARVEESLTDPSAAPDPPIPAAPIPSREDDVVIDLEGEELDNEHD
jgi:hypothetical protein